MTQQQKKTFFGLRGHVQFHIPAASHFGFSRKRGLQLGGTLVASFLHPRIILLLGAYSSSKHLHFHENFHGDSHGESPWEFPGIPAKGAVPVDPGPTSQSHPKEKTTKHVILAAS